MKVARIAELKNNLSRYLEHVRAGGTVTILDRDTPVAEIIPSAKGSDYSENDQAWYGSSNARGWCGVAEEGWSDGSTSASPRASPGVAWSAT
jgi:prevent-host-death family protein